eukprot:12686378-Ditylum_brightwellii.AAC.1
MDPIEDPSDDSDDDSKADDRGEFGTYIAIDEIMIRFFGCSHFTHRIKNKPVKEGYKWFMIADRKTYYVYNITLDERTAGNNGRGLMRLSLRKGIVRYCHASNTLCNHLWKRQKKQ